MRNAEIFQQIKTGIYPDELTEGQMDMLQRKYPVTEFNSIAIRDGFLSRADKPMQIYTLVDADFHDPMWSKGKRVVNRLGVYAIIYIPDLRVDNR